jgi:acetyl-CoA acetyltransferase family protein
MPKAREAFPRGDVVVHDSTLGWRFINPRMEALHGTHALGETAELVAEKFGVTREEQDAFALTSQRRWAAAHSAGRFTDELVAVHLPQKKGLRTFDTDEHPRPETSVADLAALPPAFRKQGGTVTAGNSSGINDGAAAVLLASPEGLARLRGNRRPLARYVASGVAGVEPKLMGLGPIPATAKALARAGITAADLDLIELNEAFAAQAIPCVREIGVDPACVNVNGGAIAIGHPLGASGARLVTTLVHELARRGARYGLASMCIGVGQGISAVFERP